MVTIPPHTSHRTQPLDVTFFGPLKNAFYREIELLMKTSQAKRVSEYDVAALINRAYVKVGTMDKGQKGFRVTGIHPWNPDVFTDEDYLSSEAMNRASHSNSNPPNPEDNEQINPGPLATKDNEQINPGPMDAQVDEVINPETRKVTIEELASPPPLPNPKQKAQKRRSKRKASVILGLTPEQEIISIASGSSQVRSNETIWAT